MSTLPSAVPSPAPGWISPGGRPMRLGAVLRLAAACCLLLALGACPGPAPVDCRVGADCASGVCLRDGRCAPEVTVDGGGPDAGQGDGGLPTTDAGAPEDAGVDAGVDAGQPVGCLPNHDGQIDRGEVFFHAGLRATFRVSGQAAFATAGGTSSDGGFLWDFTGALAGDTSRLVETKALTGEWYEAEYPDGGYVAELGQGGELLGVFSTTSDALYLQGVVSTADGATSTRLRYEPWVKVLQFPLRAGDSWETNATVTGRYNGLIVGFNLPFQTERYQSTVDRAGTAQTPFADFPVLRVRTLMTRSLNTVPSFTLRTFSWNTECFGTVAAVTSRDNEGSTELTTAAEVRRLSP